MRTALLVLAALLLAGCATNAPSDKPPLPSLNTSTTTSTVATSSTPAATPEAADIIILDYRFSPASYQEDVNGTVSWRNDGSATHTVTADDGSFDSGNLAPGARFTFTGARPGTVPYHCKIHASMRGNVTFGAASVTTPPTPSAPTPSAPPLVTIQGFAFHPASLTVRVGDTVTWQNGDGVGHSATSDAGVWDTGVIASDDAGTFTFTQAGTFGYHCKIHASMKGTIVVTA